MYTESGRSQIRWTLSFGSVLILVALIWVIQLLAHGPLQFSPPAVTADTSGTGGIGIGPSNSTVQIGFMDVAGAPSDFIDTLVLENDGVAREVDIGISGLLPGVHDTLQVLIRHDPAVVEITSVTCSDLFSEAFSPTGTVEVSVGQTAFMCALEGGVAGESGAVMRVSLKRKASGDSILELSADGPFDTRVFTAGQGFQVTPVSALIVQDPVVVPTVTPTTIPTAGPASGGSTGDGGSPVQPATSPTPSISIPRAPTNLIAVPGDRAVQLSWTPPQNDGGALITEYLVRSGDGQISRKFSVVQNPVSITGLENGVVYRFRVQAENSVGAGFFSEFSNPVVPAGPPSPPEDVSVEVFAKSGQVTLSWSPPVDTNGAEIDSYTILEASGLVESQTIATGTVSYSFSGLSLGEYRFLITATNRGGTSAAAEITVTVPSVSEQPVEPSPGNSTGDSTTDNKLRPALVEVVTQIGNAIGTNVELTDDDLKVEPHDAMLRVVLPTKVSVSSPDNSASNNFAGFSFENLTVESENGRPSIATIDLGRGLLISGEVTLLNAADGVTAELRHLSLRYAPELSSSPATGIPQVESPVFETQIVSLTGLPEFTINQLDTIGEPELPSATSLRSILLKHGWEASSEDESDGHISGIALKIEHSADMFVAGDTTFSFALRSQADDQTSAVAIKQDHSGTIHVRPTKCDRMNTDLWNCTAVFAGEAGGFSTFAVLEAIAVQTMPESTSEADGSSNGDFPPPELPTREEAQEPIPTAVATPLPLATVAAESGEVLGELTDSSTDSPSVIVLVALASIAIVTATGIVGYFVLHHKNWKNAGLSLFVVPIAASSLLIIASTADSEMHSVSASGIVVSQGDAAQQSDAVRSNFGVDGTGITVGIISDSIGCDAADFAENIATGELPADLLIVNDASASRCPFTTDRGRSLAQVVHDVAPGAKIIFSSVTNGKSTLVTKIHDLIDVGVDIIIDDLLFSDELIFQDDVVARAIEQANASGVVYITSAGEIGMASYEAQFVAGGDTGSICNTSEICTKPGNWHDFDPGPGVDQLLDISLSDPITRLMLQWDQPSKIHDGMGTLSDMDLYVFDQSGDTIDVSDLSSLLLGDPAEAISIIGHDSVQVAISHRAGIEPNLVKLVATNGAVINEFPTDSSTIIGHRNAEGAITVGPVNFTNTSAFGGVPVVEASAPTGGTNILFDLNGDLLAEKIQQQKPDFVGPSVGDTTLGVFNGSPAAAAHVAGAVALLFELRADLHSTGQLTPETVRMLLALTAIDVGAAGPDLQSGHGLVDMLAAANMLSSEPPVAVADGYSIAIDEVLTVDAPGVLGNDTDQDVPGLTAGQVTGPANGNLALQADGSFTYTPDAGFFGEVTFTYVANDGMFTSAPATVTINVTGSESLSTSVGLQGVNALANFGSDVTSLVLTQNENTVGITLVPGGPEHVILNGLDSGSYDLSASAPGFLRAETLGVVLGAVPGETVIVQSVELRAGDANNDGLIDGVDSEIVSTVFGTVHSAGERRVSTGEITDLNGDGVSNGADASLTISNIGLAEPLAWDS